MNTPPLSSSSVAKGLAIITLAVISPCQGATASTSPLSDRVFSVDRDPARAASPHPAHGGPARGHGGYDTPLRLTQAGVGGAPSEEELKLRIELLQRSMGFGGIFAPMLNGLSSGNGSGADPRDECLRRGYTDYAACQAFKAGDGWAADRLQRRDSSGTERDWYNR